MLKWQHVPLRLIQLYFCPKLRSPRKNEREFRHLRALAAKCQNVNSRGKRGIREKGSLKPAETVEKTEILGNQRYF